MRPRERKLATPRKDLRGHGCNTKTLIAVEINQTLREGLFFLEAIVPNCSKDFFNKNQVVLNLSHMLNIPSNDPAM